MDLEEEEVSAVALVGEWVSVSVAALLPGLTWVEVEVGYRDVLTT